MSEPDASGPVIPVIGYDDFARVDIRVGTVVRAEPYPGARKPALKLCAASLLTAASKVVGALAELPRKA